jgi:hypothetical protein
MIDLNQIKKDVQGITRFALYCSFFFILFSYLEGSITPFSSLISLYGGLMMVLSINIYKGLERRWSKPKKEAK